MSLGVRLSCRRTVCVSAEPRMHVRRISLGGEGNALYPVPSNYLRCRLASGGIGDARRHGVTLSHCVCVCRISLGGEGDLYPVYLTSFICNHIISISVCLSMSCICMSDHMLLCVK